MPKLAANLSMMFNEVDFLDRFGAAAACGFRAVEYLFPYAHPKQELKARLDANGLEQVLFNVAQGDWDKGERGIAALPGREEEFRAAIETGLAYARALGCPRMHVMSGLVPPKTDAARCRDVLAGNLRWAAEAAASADVTLLLEPLNPHDFPGYAVPTPEVARRVIDAVRAPNLGLQYDFYHQQMTGGRLIDTMKAHWDVIGHIQVSGVPGRHEPDDRQEIDFRFVFAEIDAQGYDGWIGCEYRPRGKTPDGLGWAAPYGIRRQN
jgi:hydroxypyruvate isomerase